MKGKVSLFNIEAFLREVEGLIYEVKIFVRHSCSKVEGLLSNFTAVNLQGKMDFFLFFFKEVIESKGRLL